MQFSKNVGANFHETFLIVRNDSDTLIPKKNFITQKRS